MEFSKALKEFMTTQWNERFNFYQKEQLNALLQHVVDTNGLNTPFQSKIELSTEYSDNVKLKVSTDLDMVCILYKRETYIIRSIYTYRECNPNDHDERNIIYKGTYIECIAYLQTFDALKFHLPELNK